MQSTDPPSAIGSRFHASFNVTDLVRSVAYYRVLLGREPVRLEKDYAKFEIEDPPLVLSLVPGHAIAGGNLNHLGLRLPDAQALVAVQLRLESAGFPTQREEGVDCCHSRQTKFWSHDPDQSLWEIYLLHADEHGDGGDPSPAPKAALVPSIKDAPRQKLSWRHHLAQGPALCVPHAANSLHEVFLEGTANLRPETFNLGLLLRDAWRALRPGGEVRIHGLTSDTVLKNSSPRLPGPALAVQHVPTHSELTTQLQSAGFADIHIEKLSDKAHFLGEEDRVAMREIVIAGTKPGHRPTIGHHLAIYLGPLAKVEDDFSNAFPRGVAVTLNIHDWQHLSTGAAAGQFLCVAPAR